MRVMFNLWHPAHVHFFRPVIERLEVEGHLVFVTARDKEVTHTLLKAYGIPFTPVGKYLKGTLAKAVDLPRLELELLRASSHFKPDIVAGISNPYGTHVSKLLDATSFVFTDTEHAAWENRLAFPLASKIVVPSCYRDPLQKYGDRVVRYAGFHELAYLHPKYFSPDPGILDRLGVSEGEGYAIVRFVDFGAAHDAGVKRMSVSERSEFVLDLSKKCRVFVTSEDDLPKQIEQFRHRIAPERLHDALAFASLYVGDGATMASEAAMLGTPAVYTNALTMGYIEELDRTWGLIHHATKMETIQAEVSKVLEGADTRQEYESRREKMLEAKVDVSDFVARLFLEQSPQPN